MRLLGGVRLRSDNVSVTYGNPRSLKERMELYVMTDVVEILISHILI